MLDNKNSAKDSIAESQKEKKMRQGNVSLILNSYNDIFSDFDPRGYVQRALSDDFLQECRRTVRDKSPSEEKFELRLLVPKIKRNVNDEIKIKIRLKNHFLKHYLEKKKEIKNLRYSGVAWFIIGVIFSLMAAFIYPFEGFYFDVLFVMIEPAGWFTVWSGLDKIFLNPKDKMPDARFYKKMYGCHITFIDY